MFTLSRRQTRALDEVISALPGGWHGLALPHGHLVVGPTGAFALTAASSIDTALAAKRIARTATAAREELARRLSWAPFVDPMVVVERAAPSTDAASVVPARLLADVLTAGRHVLEPDEIDRIVDAIRRWTARPHFAIG